jgi:hypothetical protein
VQRGCALGLGLVSEKGDRHSLSLPQSQLKGVSDATWPKDIHDKRQSRRAAPSSGRSAHWNPSGERPAHNASQNAQRNYERYLTLARAEAQTGNTVGAEAYYQYAEHFSRLIYSEPDCFLMEDIRLEER